MDLIYAFVDTCVLSDIIIQYDPRFPHRTLTVGKFLKRDMLRIVNRIIEDTDESSGYIIASTFAFVELINKRDEIFKGTISTERLMAIMSQPPSWFIVEDVKNETALNYCDLPGCIKGENVSSDDAIHVATALQRGDDIYFLTTDHVLCNMNLPRISFVST